MPMSTLRASLFASALIAVHGAPMKPHKKLHTLSGETCGLEGLPACSTTNADGTTTNMCISNPSVNDKTIGAVPSEAADGTVTYMCEECGKPYELACECTFDNDAAGDSDESDYTVPCQNQMSHWCLFEPQYATVTAPDGYFYCIHNETDTPFEVECGTLGHEACLNEKDSSYACMSPSPTGQEVYAIQQGGPTSTYMCVAVDSTTDDGHDDLAAKAATAKATVAKIRMDAATEAADAAAAAAATKVGGAAPMKNPVKTMPIPSSSSPTRRLHSKAVHAKKDPPPPEEPTVPGSKKHRRKH